MNSPTIQTENFEGPIELLLRLIQERKLPINEISLAEVADAYIEKMRTRETIDVGAMTQFIVIAATLMVIKSKSLLPVLQLSDDEEEDIEDLEQRLRMYQIYVDAGAHIIENYGTMRSYGRSVVPQPIVFTPDPTVTSDTLAEALRGVLDDFPVEEEKLPTERIQEVIHIEDVMDDLMERVRTGMQVSFNDMTSKVRSAQNQQEYRAAKSYAVVGFLAMLEMVKNGIIDVLQDATFTDISINKTHS